MHIVLAPDKFKGSLTAFEFCDAVEEGITSIIPNAHIVRVPLADGGDGTIDIINHYMQGSFMQVEVNNPFFQKVNASYLYSSMQQTAFIEMAEASGAKLLKAEELNVMEASTFGTGELIKDALERGVETIILGIGGSATNDCGIGMANALGYQFLDAFNQPVHPLGKNLINIKRIEGSQVHNRLRAVTFKIACDVNNPLYGLNGAAHVYSRQKGASEEEVLLLDKGLQSFSKVLDGYFNVTSQKIAGAGAAGGMGIGSKTFLQGNLVSGIELIKELANFNQQIKNADWIITGEGKLDDQTQSGKTIQGIINVTPQDTQIAAFCGKVDLSEKEYNTLGIQYASDVMSKAMNFEDALENSQKYVTELAKEFARSLIE